MIPPVMHRIWLRDPMPEPVARAGAEIRRLHPGWEVLDWTDPDALPSLINRDLFDQVRTLFPDDWRRAEAGLLRLELLWRYGGIYLDTDVTVHRHLGELIDGRECVVARSPHHVAGHHPLTDCVMAARRDDPWIRWLLVTQEVSVKDHLADLDVKVPRLGHVIGPWHLTRIYEDEGGKEAWPTVTVLPADDMFHSGLLTHGWNNGRRLRGVAEW